ncbi:glycoside hydrolase family 18 protein [Schizophyllum amplum]|uniref:Glycoside hydrolase family 18 protein n=1 Tax=Schizophyllum amplum TaxID=97359 RepID=A0A550BY27_9AGAR|nr:glycoside hydrolase family 18 protein [Auriculariopsis ampla]
MSASASASASAPAATASSGAGGATTTGALASGWYPGWLAGQNSSSDISWEKYNMMTFGFATTTSDSSVLALDETSQAALPQFVSDAHSHNVSALLSIGGWTGSLYYSTAVATEENRTAFAGAILDMVSQYQLDGIDFDWEYPNKQGVGCNAILETDSANFLSFLQELRANPNTPANLTLTAAVGVAPFVGEDGEPMTDVSGFATVLDHIAIMNYDLWGSWSDGVGPNAPLNDTCSDTPAGSAVSAVSAWTAAGFPASQIALGVAAYGHSFAVNASSASPDGTTLAAYPAFDKANQPLGSSDDPTATGDEPDVCGVVGSSISGVFDFWGMVSEGYLGDNGTAADGVLYRYDECSQTPYVWNAETEVMISYDDATSFAAKGKFITDMGLKGFAMWHVVGDYKDILLDSIDAAIGFQSPSA